MAVQFKVFKIFNLISINSPPSAKGAGQAMCYGRVHAAYGLTEPEVMAAAAAGMPRVQLPVDRQPSHASLDCGVRSFSIMPAHAALGVVLGLRCVFEVTLRVPSGVGSHSSRDTRMQQRRPSSA